MPDSTGPGTYHAEESRASLYLMMTLPLVHVTKVRTSAEEAQVLTSLVWLGSTWTDRCDQADGARCRICRSRRRLGMMARSCRKRRKLHSTAQGRDPKSAGPRCAASWLQIESLHTMEAAVHAARGGDVDRATARALECIEAVDLAFKHARAYEAAPAHTKPCRQMSAERDVWAG